MTQTYKYSVILPVFNEESCLPEVIERINTSLSSLKSSYEIICVDDGSTDSTWAMINRFHQESDHIKGLKFSRNFGHQIAVYAGIKHASGQYIAVLDADGQDPPEVLPKMFQKCADSYDVVYAIRKKRKENIIKKMCYTLFYRLYRLVVPFYVPLDSGDFAVFTKPVADFIQSLPEKKPFIRGLRGWYGGRQTGMEYDRQSRISGKPKYSYYKLFLLAVNASISFSKMPLRLITLFGICISLISFLCGLYFIFLKTTIGIDVPGWTSTALLIVLFGGINLFVLGIIGEYVGDIFDEVKNRPQFLIGQKVGL